MKRAVIIVVSLALTITSQANAHPHFLWHHKSMSLEAKVRYFQRSVRHDRSAIAMLSHQRRSLESTGDLGWYRAAYKWHRALYKSYWAKLRAKIVAARVPAPSDWISRQIYAASAIGRASSGDPWPNCPDPYDGSGSSWNDTVNCENGGNWYDSPGYYRCGLQFDPMWERVYGRLCP